MRDDREEKEAEIRRRFGGAYDESESQKFLVSTQVCEISLDLSADLLLTEVAPIDAIVQRAGRLHRSGVHPEAGSCHDERSDDCSQCSVLPSSHEYQCVVYAPLDDHDRWLPYAEETESANWTILERTADMLSGATRYRFDRSLEWVNEVYEGLAIDYDATELIRASEQDWLYGDERRVAPDADSGDDRLQIRDISSYRRAVLMQQYTDSEGQTWTPSDRWQAEHNCPRSDSCGIHVTETTSCDREWWQFASRYAVEIPQWWIQSDDHPVEITATVEDADGQIETSEIVNIEYSYELGADPQISG